MIEKTPDFDAEVVRYLYTPQVPMLPVPELPPELEAVIAEYVREMKDKLFTHMLFNGVAVRAEDLVILADPPTTVRWSTPEEGGVW